MTKQSAKLDDPAISDKAARPQRKKIPENIMPEPILRNPGHDKLEEVRQELRSYQTELEMQNEELRRSQEILELARAKYFNFYNLAPVGYFTINDQGVVLEVNLTACNLLGATRERLLNQPFTKFIIPDDQDIYYMFNKQILSNHAPLMCELRMAFEDNIPFWVNIKATNVVNVESGEMLRYIVMSDITKSREAAEHLQETLREIKRLKDKLKDENLYLLEEINLIHSHKNIVGNSDAICAVLKQVEQVAPSDSRVLIQGETGTGKELIAHAIHNLSPRKQALMIKVNCAALPPTLIESELFGREKGAFTGALSKQLGRFELADGSTIFLDEVDSLPLELQAKLLRVLECGEFERLGSSLTMKVDVRIIAATNCDLAAVVKAGGFREDLYYRLNVFQITVPPLRDRREDIMPLVWSFVQEFSARMGKRIESIPQKTAEVLQAYSWPGNIRELKNVTERAMIITTGPVLHLDVPNVVSINTVPPKTLEEMEKLHIIEALNATGWQVSGKGGAAEILGINPKTLGSRMQKLGIQRKRKNA